MSAVKGIDVSKWQGNIIWASVKASGIGFAIIKAGGSDAGFYKDPKFEQNYTEAKAVGMPVGAYYFVGSKCISYEDGVADAKRFIEMLNGKSFEYPCYIDLESTKMEDKAGATEACIGFVKTMEDAGYYSGIYASDISGFCDRLDLSQLSGIEKWVASYGKNPTYVATHGMWQYSDKGTVNGITGYVDMDEAYTHYPSIVRELGMNGFNAAEEQTDFQDGIDWKSKYEKIADQMERIKAIIEER